ncbi:FAD-dependent oxidoreductase [Brachybacterium sp. EF45031]|uniref:NAD(P)/FAD-dependent oxidoreductase n=1 Tax=Brachybacterium sillae TaxID=2810536 RepID=UPI00217E88CE|nr:NAD(P)/FAD-dependent oxidoreductase [Brachybacterium sillae]MCS6711867.1 FAD-dependent oxidoreductase [Brachybacterium sillae]
MEQVSGGRPIRCAVNPRCGLETEFPADIPTRDAEGRTAIVVGGGPAGAEAAETLALRGMTVDLYEATDSLGGQIVPGSNPPGKGAMRWVIENYEVRLRTAGVEVHLNTEATVDSVRESGADAVVLATGALPSAPRSIPGIDGPTVVDAVDVLEGRVEVGPTCVVVGSGMTGLETAELLMTQGHTVSVHEMAEAIGAGAFRGNIQSVAMKLEAGGVPMRTGHRLTAITPSEAVFDTAEGEVHENADTVVLAMGMRPRRDLAEALDAAGVPCTVVGDAAQVGKVATAVLDGFRTGRSLELADAH